MKLLLLSTLCYSTAFGFFHFNNAPQHAAPVHHSMAASAEEVAYPQTYGAKHRQELEDQAAADEADGGRGRSTGNSYTAPQDVIDLADSMRIMPEADEQAVLRHCLTKRAHKFPEKNAYWDSLRQYLATDWFKLWGYQCGQSYKCWRSVLETFPQWSPDQARDISRCVMKLVKSRMNGNKKK
jgi:hypothetical protein